jgi:hypothetical protein
MCVFEKLVNPLKHIEANPGKVVAAPKKKAPVKK